ncbi:YggT family protein [Bartonella doshiae]|uniref:YGGT family n=2 Tax=Bartonella doshiae TaxID=33044 RepID=A0A380ZDS3_BARDO|nr:YggT family protein [Bartonella doshiae]EJF82083.1 hypothetical protein MCS_00508 [Bartonella doshiae NCTC 12862 = ATCC 700133]MBB6159078.1 YggT family protein [Bartonella doshiae]SUV44492.1 YGGT family [Bartonella doshiae]
MIYILLEVIDLSCDIYINILIARVIFSWLHLFNIINVGNRFVAIIGNFLYRITEPVLSFVRRALPNLGAIDISPIIVFIVIYFIRILMWRAYAAMYL